MPLIHTAWILILTVWGFRGFLALARWFDT
jgi:hypothetical protein